MTTNVDIDVGQGKCLLSAGESMNQCNHCGNQSGASQKPRNRTII